VRFEERHHLGPQLEGGRLAVARPVVGEKGVAGVLEDVDGERLAGSGDACEAPRPEDSMAERDEFEPSDDLVNGQ
jgi:hypothetical protein